MSVSGRRWGSHRERPDDAAPLLLVGLSPRSWVYRWPRLHRLYWSLLARDWDELPGRAGAPGMLPVLGRIQELLGTSTASVVDLGCGTGRHGLALANMGFTVLGLDSSSGMLRRARAKAALAGPGSMTVRHADLNDPLPLPAASFDAALCMGVLDCIRDPDRFLGEVRRSLRPGGLLVVAVVRLHTDPWVTGTRAGLLLRVMRSSPGWRRRTIACDRQALHGLLARSGFREVEEHQRTRTLVVLAQESNSVARCADEGT